MNSHTFIKVLIENYSIRYIVDKGETKMDETIQKSDVIAAYDQDFPNGIKTSIEDIMGLLCDNGESITLKPLDNGYTGQIYATPEKQVVVHQRLLGLLHKKGEIIEDVRHPPIIASLAIDSRDHGYTGTLNLSDEGHDLKDYMIAIDRKSYGEGVFIKHGSLGVLGELMTNGTFELEISGKPLEVKSDIVPIGCYTDKEENLVGCGVVRENLFGPIPKGEHELTLYVRDEAGNRSFATMQYKI